MPTRAQFYWTRQLFRSLRRWEKVQHSECKCLRSRLNQQGTLIGPNINQEDEEGRGRVWVRVWDPHPSLSNLNQTKMPLSLIKATVGSPAHLGPNNAQTNNVTIAQRRGHSHSLLCVIISLTLTWFSLRKNSIRYDLKHQGSCAAQFSR